LQPIRDTQRFTVIYVKSVLVGLLALVVVCIVLPILGLILYGFTDMQPEGVSIGWDPISLVKQSPILPGAVAVGVFVAGFLWEFRRLTYR
jgi:ABC-type Fe3+ transport system permease subunit